MATEHAHHTCGWVAGPVTCDQTARRGVVTRKGGTQQRLCQLHAELARTVDYVPLPVTTPRGWDRV